ncbi:MAG: UvrD-helicase domain-containing protein [Candidatus Omnitrophota bacterium]|nr:MAG: UvrD-helicase domain-containing protein [Candidatus Omnitrophota bacterium]
MNPNQLKFPEVVVVEASAGSGKTYALAKRYLQLLINPNIPLEFIPLRSILAITFTNKAAVEMKERILELLKRIAFDAFESKDEERDILGMLGVDKKFAQTKANLIMDELIRHYSFFQAQTIDSFINALLLGCALRIDRSASFSIKRDYRHYLVYSLDAVIEEAAADKEVFGFLEEFLEHYLFVENRSGWFPKDDILELMESLFRLSNKYGGTFRDYPGKGQDVIKKKIDLFEKIKELAKNFPQGMNKSAQNSIAKFTEISNNIFEISDLPSMFQKPIVSMNKGNSCPSSYAKKWEKMHLSLKGLVELEATVSYNPYVKLFRGLLTFFQFVSRKEDMLFLEELNHKARALFDEEGITVAELYYRLATRFRHYLIDEFQDTSILQWRNLKMMVEEALSSGGSLFYVGDKKQAIYRFRGGEAQLFDDVRKAFGQFNVKEEHLIKNWRSQKAIVEFNNQVFSKDNILRMMNLSGIAKELGNEKGAIGEITDVFKDAVQNYKENNKYGYVCVERIDEKNQEERNAIMQEKILNLIEELKERFRYQDLAILTRDNDEVELITSWLLAAGIPVESEKTLNILENPLIKELVAFLNFLHSPIDDLSFAAFILGEIFSCVSGISNDQIRDFIFELHREGKLDSGISLYNLFRQNYPRIWNEYIDEFFKNVGFISPYELVTSIYHRFAVMEKFKDAQSFFMKFLELIKTNEDEHIGLGEFLSYLKEASAEDLYVNVIHSDSVKILTIHKAKGLEFGVVIIPFLRMDITPETGGKGTNSHVVGQAGENLGLVRITKYYRAYSKELQEIYSKDYKKACIDELNNIYVALTRAQFELYIFIPRKSGIGNNKAQFIIPQELSEKGKRIVYSTEDKGLAQPLLDLAPSHYCNWIELLKDEFGDPQRIRNRANIISGNIFHFILSRIPNTFGQDRESLMQEALSAATLEHPNIESPKDFEQKIKGLLINPDLNHIFYVPDGMVYREIEVVDSRGDTKRIDRLIVKEKEVWVIDYKLSVDKDEDYRKQIKEYMRITKDIYPGKIVKGFLLYLDQEKTYAVE